MAGNRSLIRWAVIVAVVGVAVAAYVLRPAADAERPAAVAQASAAAALPRLLDLGADKCVPCKMMVPVLEGLKRDFAGVLTVEFIDVWKDPAAAQPYDVNMIPTQIFFAQDGKELFRHEGFFSRENILAKWRELGYALPNKDA